MNARGHYGASVGARGHSTLGPRGRAAVGSQLQQVLELTQSYNSPSVAPVTALLNALGAEGHVVSTGPDHWEVALPNDGVWVRVAWQPTLRQIVVTITNKKVVPAAAIADVQAHYQTILDVKVSPNVQRFGAVAVGSGPVRPFVPHAAVGRLYHSVGDREDAVKQMDLDWTALFQDLAVQAGELTHDPHSSSGYHFTSQTEFDALKPDPKKVAWWKSYAKPRFRDWTKFRVDQLGQDATVAPNYQAWTERFATNWSTYEEWKDKLDALRAAAQQAGFTIGVPAAQSLPTTVVDDVSAVAKKGAGAVATGVGDVWTLAKYGAWAVLGIGAVVALSSVVQNLRSGKDPAEKYVELIRDQRRRTGRAAALPPAAQLALPAGEPA